MIKKSVARSAEQRSLTSIEGLQAAFGSMEQELKTRQFDFFTRMGAALLSEQSKADQLIKASTGESAIAAMGSQIKSVQDATVQMGDYISESMQAFQGFLPEAGLPGGGSSLVEQVGMTPEEQEEMAEEVIANATDRIEAETVAFEEALEQGEETMQTYLPADFQLPVYMYIFHHRQ